MELHVALLLYQVIVIGRAMLDWPDRARRELKRWTLLQVESDPVAAASLSREDSNAD